MASHSWQSREPSGQAHNDDYSEYSGSVQLGHSTPSAPSVVNNISIRLGRAPWGSNGAIGFGGKPAREIPQRKGRGLYLGMGILFAVLIAGGVVLGVVLSRRGDSGNSTADGQLAAAEGGATPLALPSSASRSTSRTGASSTRSATLARTSSAVVTSAAPTTTPPASSSTTAAPSSSLQASSSTVRPTTTTAAPPPPVPAPFFFIETQCVQPGMVALTFDDGPTEFTQGLLDLLDQLGIKATFFINGKTTWGVDVASQYGQYIITRMANAGHCIGVHTWTHADLTLLGSDDAIASEVQQVENAIAGYIGRRPYFVRPPYGYYTDRVLNVFRNLGYSAAVLWNYDTNDWRHEDDVAASVTVFRDAAAPGPGNGNILPLMHDRLARVAEVINQVVPMLRANGQWRFVTMDQCLGRPCFR
ncbi:carbohydrate esterase family 4 protein [Gonapodya prolifera JEL478]|uniref:Carbohydrate esterase family 4 protein n=1 Tax=Gonapodya prolifera (strain JEL478) TaxID=1344416 RepID=A0A139AC01_GONPJ|nr:carbohydrate esterase family 4 protein [Gonapodya prolifera JEL478]|eukprot:KXS14287.1 carbohydrate esterase family 4 protein [Gonapodya prolifera JEL478]